MATDTGAIQLMGQWLPGTVSANSADKKGMGDNLGWFPFPAVTGGAGDPNDGLGGGNGFAIGKDAPLAETVDFLHFLVGTDAANRWGALNSGILPTTVGTETLGHRSAAEGRSRRSSKGQLRSALPRPGDHARSWRGDQRGSGNPLFGLRHARVGGAGHQHGRPDPVVAPTRNVVSNGPAARPARSLSSVTQMTSSSASRPEATPWPRSAP